jgi:anion-transporting  ArsA/GET3 family ATPase
VRRGIHTRLYSDARREFLFQRGGPVTVWERRAEAAGPLCSATVSGLLDHRLIFVTGKGGVGKSTVATAIGLLGARSGRRTVVAELSGQDRIQRSFDWTHHGERGGSALFEEVELAPGLFTISIDPQHAMEEYLRVKTGALGSALGSSRLFQTFAMATPGMRELLSVGKVWELSQLRRRTDGAEPYDLVVVDAPATGHGVGILRTPGTFAEISRVGPIAQQASAIAATIADGGFTGIVAVATAEEMPVNETLVLRDALGEDGLELDGIVVNGLYPQRFSEEESEQLTGLLDRLTAPTARGALRAALSEHARARSQTTQRDRLRDGVAVPLLELPYVFADEIGRGELELLADVLGTALTDAPDAEARR